MFRKNVAGQFIHFQGVDSSTGGIKSGVTWTIRRCIDGTFAAGGGTVTEDSTNGWYKCALSQADTNGNNIAFNFTGTGAVPQTVNIVTTAADPTDAVRLGLTALPNAAAEAAGGLYTRGSGAGQINQSANGMVDTNTVRWLNTAVTAATAGIPDTNVKNINNVVAATPGASGGILISGSNAGTTTLAALTITGVTTHTGNVLFSDGITVSAPSTTNRAGVSITGNGSGAGVSVTGGAAVTTTAAGHGILIAGGAASTGVGGTSGIGIKVTGGAGAASNNGAAEGLTFAAGGTTTVSGANAVSATGTGNGHGISLAGAGTGFGLNGTQNGNVTANITGNLSGSVGSVTGSVGNITGVPKVDVDTIKTNPVVNAGTVTFPTGATLASTTNITAGNVTNVNGNVTGTVATLTTYTGNTPQTGDTYARLGAPAGASHAADVAAVKTDTAAVKVQTDKLAFTVANQIDANVIDWKGATAPAMTGDAYARLGAPSGASVSADVAAVKVDTAAVKAKTDNLPSDPADESLVIAATDAIVTLINGLNDISAGDIWDVTLSGHLTSGTTGAALNASGGAGDPWSTALPGAYGAGTAGFIVGTNLDEVVSTRLAASGYTAPPTAADNATAVLTTAMTESYAAHHGVPTMAQAIFEMLAFLTEKDVSSTTVTTKKRDGSTTARTYTLDSATAPTSLTGA